MFVFKDKVSGAKLIPAVFKNFVQPVLTEDGVWGGDNFAVKASSYHPGYMAYKAFDGDFGSYSYYHPQYQGIAFHHPHEIMWYNQEPLKISSITIYNYQNDRYYLRNYEILASDDDVEWHVVTSGTAQEDSNLIMELPVPSSEYPHKFWSLKSLSSVGNPDLVTYGEIAIHAYIMNRYKAAIKEN